MNKLIIDQLDSLIADAILKHDENRLFTYRAIKTEFTKWKTAKNAKPLDQNVEFQIIQKMVKQREESAKIYDDANRPELANNERAEIAILNEFLPKPVGIDEIEWVIGTCGIEPLKQNMGQIIKAVKEKYPTVDGKLAAQIVSSHLL